MPSVPHFLHIYQKPSAGDAFILRKQVFNYRHAINAMGWFDTANCQLAVSQIEGEQWLENFIGNRVAVYVDNPAEPVWEGLITRITLEAGGVVFTRSLDEMYNGARVTWRPSSSTNASQTAFALNTDSIAVYGAKQGSIEAAVEYGAGAGRMNTIRDLMLAFQGWPKSSASFGGAVGLVSVEMQGFFHTLEWETVSNAGITNLNPHVLITNIVASITNSSTFIDNADATEIEANTAFATSEGVREGETVWQSIQKWAEPGDGTNRWIAGVSPATFNRSTRRLYYRAFNNNVEYIAHVRDGMRVRNLYGGLVRPWTVKPDRAIRITDVLVGWNAQGDDPREFYIDGVQYDAESQQVTLQSVDDPGVEGAFQLKKFYKARGRPFGAPVRL